MNQIHPTREPCPQRRPLGIDWDGIARLWWPPGHRALVPDAPLARALDCTSVAVRTARTRRGCLAWQALPLPTAEQLRAKLEAAGLYRPEKSDIHVRVGR